MTQPTPTQLWADATPAQRDTVMQVAAGCSDGLISEGLAAMQRAGLDLTVDPALPAVVAYADVALRHRNRIGRIPGFDPAVYAEMVAPLRSVFGELHPDDHRDLAAHDMWQVQDRWTGELIPTATETERARGEQAMVLLRSSALESLR